MKKDLYDFVGDSMITSDEWDHFQYVIGEELKALDIKGSWVMDYLPGFADFEYQIKQRLIDAGFNKDTLKDSTERKHLLRVMDFSGMEYRDPIWLKESPIGLPHGTYTVRDDYRMFWVKPHIEAAIRTLESLAILKELLIKKGQAKKDEIKIMQRLPSGEEEERGVNKDAVRVYLRTLEMVVNLVRAGNIAELAKAREEGEAKSLEKRKIKKAVMRGIILQIFKNNPHRPRTLGEVWNKIESGKFGISLTKHSLIKPTDVFIAKTGKDSHGEDIVEVYIGIAGKKNSQGEDMFTIPKGKKKLFDYKKRSLQAFINEVKNTIPKVT